MAQLHETTFRMVKGIILLIIWIGLLWIVFAPIFAARKQRRRNAYNLAGVRELVRLSKPRAPFICCEHDEICERMGEPCKASIRRQQYDAGIPIG